MTKGYTKKTIAVLVCVLVLTATCLSQRGRRIEVLVTASGQASANSDGTAVGALQAQANADQAARINAQNNLQNACTGQLVTSSVIWDSCNGMETVTCTVTMQGLCQPF